MSSSCGQHAVVDEWCDRCSTQHGDVEPCPGAITITGQVEHSWRGVFKTRRGGEAYVVLLAPAGELWSARIMTSPNVLWTIPGRGKAMRFVATDREGAEGQAVRFVREHCRRLGYQSLEDLPSSVKIEMLQPPEPAHTVSRAPRKKCPVSIRWGIDVPNKDAATGDLSESGLFLITPEPPEPGTSVRIQIRNETCTLPLNGRVVWARKSADSDSPPGMGIHLIRPPKFYTQFVRGLA